MSRIPGDEIDRLKAQVSVLALAEAKGIVLVRHGADWLGCCPFHADKTPSLVISPLKNLWHCLGACRVGGSVIDWVMRAEQMSFRHAVEWLRVNAGRLPCDATAAVALPTKLIAPLSSSEDDVALLDAVIGFYHLALKQSPEALAYLAKRGLTHPGLIDHFQLGYANRTLAYRLPEKQIKSGAAVRGQLQRLGLLRSSGHEHFTGSLIVPIANERAQVVGVYGRKIADKQRDGTPLHLYLPGPHCGVFNLADWCGSDEVILCEAVIDALTFWCAGYRHVTSAYGVNGFTDELLQAFVVHGVKRVLIAYDRDEAGDGAAEALVPRLAAHGIASARVLFPKGMDANAYALKVGPPDKSLGLVLKQAVPLGKAIVPPRPASVLVESPPFVAAAAPIESVPHAPAPASSHEPAAEPLATEVNDQQIVVTFGERRYRVRGLAKNLSADTLRVNVFASAGEGLHVDTFDLYAAKARAVFVKQAAFALGVEDAVIERDLARLLLKLEDLQDSAIRASVAPKKSAPMLTPAQQDAAMAMLRDPRLSERIVHDVAVIGVVGEDANALVGYLACVSRKLERPLAVLIQSTSAAGKSTLMDALLSLMPEAERVHYSAMTGQSLFYLGESDLRHKILAIAEEEGVRQAAYALKLLQSQGELTIASTGKDPTTGKLVTEEYRVEGPVMLFLTTTAIEIEEELLNRCLVLTINESREQTEAIHRRQRAARTLAGLLATKEAEAIRGVHRAAQQVLRPLAVVNPYAERLTFRSESTRLRRDHAKYLTLIDAITFLHQYQRPIKTATVAGEAIDYIEVTLDDIALANRLASEVFGRSLDELPPQTRRVLGVIARWVEERMQRQRVVRSDVRFTRKEVRALAGITDTALRLHMDRLVDMEYLLIHRGGTGQRFVYELLFDGDVSSALPQLVGLLDAESLRGTATMPTSHPTRATSQGEGPNLTPGMHPDRMALVPTSLASETPRLASVHAGSSAAVPDAALPPPSMESSSLVAEKEKTALLRSARMATQRKPNGAVVAP
jgi:DNA primase